MSRRSRLNQQILLHNLLLKTESTNITTQSPDVKKIKTKSTNSATQSPDVKKVKMESADTATLPDVKEESLSIKKEETLGTNFIL